LTFSSAFKKFLLGSVIPQEYICLANENIIKPLRLFVSTPRSKLALEITNTHILLGYKPLIFGIIADEVEAQELDLSNKIQVLFTMEDASSSSPYKQSIARLLFEKMESRSLNGKKFVLYGGTYGSHKLLNIFQQLNNRLFDSLKALKKGNVFLPGNLYEQVRVAYAIPRAISIITVGGEQGHNMFPTDLHGLLSPDIYAGSLRINGKACAQVQASRQVVIANVQHSWHRQAYALGKNHMQDLHSLPESLIHKTRSDLFQLPLPLAVSEYKELQLKDFIDAGIHRIFFYDIVNQVVVDDTTSRLTHVHRYYLQWRQNRALTTEYLLR
jgi:flavin reductase (DIM6/NTAB) family NADH-FMN oxidoreductase RutF